MTEAATFPGARVKVAGQALDDAADLVEVRVEDNLFLPDAFLVRVTDPDLGLVDKGYLDLGNEVEIELSGPDGSFLSSMIKGQITSLEPTFEQTRAQVVIRGYDHSHILHRTRRTQTYQNMTSSDIARKVATRAGLSTGTIDDTTPPYKFIQQNNETDWELLWRLARLHDHEVVVLDKVLHFRRPSAGSEVSLVWGETLFEFRPRITGVQQVKEVVVRAWDPATKATFEATAQVPQPASQIGVSRGSVSDALGGGTLTIANAYAESQEEVEELAKSVASRVAGAYLEAEGVCAGNEKIKAGVSLKLDGLGQRFNGTYRCSSSTHVFRGGRGYETRFAVSGRAAHALVDLTAQSQTNAFGASVVIGKVTQNQDPDGLGRVRVTYPALGTDNEGWWARIAAPSAGKDRGLLMMPIVGEEVLVAFESGDVRSPFILGSLWNGKDTPGELVQADGSFALHSDKQVRIASKGAISLHGDDDFTIEASGKITGKADSDISISGSANVTVKAGTSLTIEGGTDLTIKTGGASVTLRSAGTIQISGTQIMLG